MLTFVSRVHNSKIMLGMLIKVLCGHAIATRRRLSREGSVTFEDLMRGASDLDVRSGTIETVTSLAGSVAYYGKDCYRYYDHAVGCFVLFS